MSDTSNNTQDGQGGLFDRERFYDPEELFRTAFDAFRKTLFTSARASISEDSQDGHTAKAQMSITGSLLDPDLNATQFDPPQLEDLPIHHPTGGGHTMTHPTKKDDEGTLVFHLSNFDSWHQSGGTNNVPVDLRRLSMSDATWLPGGRSEPRKLKDVSQVSSQQRDDEGKHVVDVNSGNGVTHSSETMVVAAVGQSTGTVWSNDGKVTSAPKVCVNCSSGSG